MRTNEVLGRPKLVGETDPKPESLGHLYNYKYKDENISK